MKIRNGFVSNSSSTSFIVPANMKDEAERRHLKLFKVSELIDRMSPLVEAAKKMSNWDDEDYPYFFIYSMCEIDIPYYNQLVELEGELPGAYISDSYDRDYAYENGTSERFSAFETDL